MSCKSGGITVLQVEDMTAGGDEVPLLGILQVEERSDEIPLCGINGY